jgi:hypothetical protein
MCTFKIECSYCAVRIVAASVTGTTAATVCSHLFMFTAVASDVYIFRECYLRQYILLLHFAAATASYCSMPTLLHACSHCAVALFKPHHVSFMQLFTNKFSLGHAQCCTAAATIAVALTYCYLHACTCVCCLCTGVTSELELCCIPACTFTAIAATSEPHTGALCS